SLTPREVEVLALLATGMANKLIAHHLGISEHTAKFHVTAVMAKLGATGRTDAVIRAARRGMVSL
ncbi:MAG: LuxR family DNA-binding response regulator, partial [Myxococcaceae bacterium]|nr:LuxR family DNA-binding response regulator [Myxococcaceae bacterium]